MKSATQAAFDWTPPVALGERVEVVRNGVKLAWIDNRAGGGGRMTGTRTAMEAKLLAMLDDAGRRSLTRAGCKAIAGVGWRRARGGVGGRR